MDGILARQPINNAIAGAGHSPEGRISRLILYFLIFWLTACGGPAVRQQHRGVDHRSPFEAAEVSNLEKIPFTIQVGAFSTTARASRYASHLQALGLDAYYFIDGDSLWKVRFERFKTREDAHARAALLKAKGYIDDYFVVRPGIGVHRGDPPTALRNSLVATARRFIGSPYRWGGTSAKRGFDCSGLTMTVYRLNGLELPRNSRNQYRAGRAIPRHALKPGDLVFFATGRKGNVSHVGIFTGRSQFIHAPGRGSTIEYASMRNAYFRSRFMGARRYF